MQLANVFALTALAVTAYAQTPLQFPIVTENRLVVVYESSYLNLTNSPGMLVPRNGRLFQLASENDANCFN